MSLAANDQITPILVRDKRLVWSERANFGVVETGKLYNERVLPTTTYSVANWTFNAQPPSPEIAISREIFMQASFTINFTGLAGANGRLLDPSVFDAPRQFPINSVIQSLGVTLNNTQISQNNYQVVHELFHFSTPESDYKGTLSMCPAMPDYFQLYSDAYTSPGGKGISKDPLASTGQTSQYFETRGGFPFTVNSNPLVAPGAPTTASVTFTTTEPLILSPFMSTTDDVAALIGVNTLTIQVLFLPGLERLWSHSDSPQAGVIQTTSVSLENAPALLLTFISPQDSSSIPRSVVYNYSSTTVYQTDGIAPVPGNTEFTMTTQNSQLNYIPRRIYLYLKRSDFEASISTTDTWASILGVSITFDNQSGVLSSSGPQQLYNISRNSGCNLSWSQWSTYTGSILCIDVGRTLMLTNQDESPSMAATKQLQIKVQAKNICSTPITFTMYVVTCADGLITIGDNTTIPQNNVLSPIDVVNARAEGSGVQIDFSKSNNFYGGLFKRVGKAAKGVSKALSDSKLLSTAAMLSGRPDLAAAASLAGYGHVGGALVGGRRMSKDELRRRMM